ncbi:4Fe-4S dicluster domain-containing protein [Chloroflexota bacterium]
MKEQVTAKTIRWGMVIDLVRCNGCMTCVMTCKLENFMPPGIFWNRVYDYEIGEYPAVTRRILTVPCMHCSKPVCVDVCPTGASQQSEEGIVFVDYDKCIGCSYCIISCPYDARSQFKGERYYYGEPTERDLYPDELKATYQRFKEGTSTKCTFCMDRVNSGLSSGKKPGVDPEATPLCVINCPSIARIFGDLNDPDSEVSRLIRQRKGLRLHEELGTEPSVWYLQA